MRKKITIAEALTYCMDKKRIREIGSRHSKNQNIKLYKYLQECRLIYDKTGTLPAVRALAVLERSGFSGSFENLFVELPEGITIPKKH